MFKNLTAFKSFYTESFNIGRINTNIGYNAKMRY